MDPLGPSFSPPLGRDIPPPIENHKSNFNNP